MVRFMMLTVAVLGWGFYELSGGTEFTSPEVVPAPRLVAYVASQPEPAPDPMLGAAHASPAPAVIPASYALPVVTAPSEFASAPPEPITAPADTRTVTGSRVNMRGGPGTGHPIVAVLSRGEPTEVVEVVGRWARIRSGEAEGWMALSMLSEPA